MFWVFFCFFFNKNTTSMELWVFHCTATTNKVWIFFYSFFSSNSYYRWILILNSHLMASHQQKHYAQVSPTKNSIFLLLGFLRTAWQSLMERINDACTVFFRKSTRYTDLCLGLSPIIFLLQQGIKLIGFAWSPWWSNNVLCRHAAMVLQFHYYSSIFSSSALSINIRTWQLT